MHPQFILVLQYHMPALHPQGLKMCHWTQYPAPVIPNTVYYAQDTSAYNISRTKTAEATTTTCSSMSSTVEGNLTPIVPNTVDFPPLSGAQVTTTTMTASSVPIPPPILTGQIGCNSFQFQNISSVSQSLN